jgi:hypothetical protein
LTLAILVVCISGVLRGLPHPPKIVATASAHTVMNADAGK